MSKIKTRESVKDIKVLDKAAVASERMKTALIRSKDQMQNLMDDGQVSPSEYAEDKIKYAAEDVVDRVRHDASSGAKKAVNKGKEAYREHREEKRIQKNEERVKKYEEELADLRRLPPRSRKRQEIPQRKMSRHGEPTPVSSGIRQLKRLSVQNTLLNSLPVLRANRR